jgi:hypothetical protein
MLKSWMVTGTLTKPVTVPLVPVTVTLNVATPVEHVTERPVVAAGGTLTLAAIEAVQPAGAPVVTRLTGPETDPVAVIVIIEEPATVASVVMDVGLADKVSVPPPIFTGTLTLLDSVLGAVPVVPVTVTVNVAEGNGLQLTDRTAPLIVAVQLVWVVLAVKVTMPVNPLIPVTEIVEVPAVPGVVRLIEAGLELSMKSWTVTKIPTVRVIEPLTP